MSKQNRGAFYFSLKRQTVSRSWNVVCDVCIMIIKRSIKITNRLIYWISLARTFIKKLMLI